MKINPKDLPDGYDFAAGCIIGISILIVFCLLCAMLVIALYNLYAMI
jgi:hypothetical protein